MSAISALDKERLRQLAAHAVVAGPLLRAGAAGLLGAPIALRSICELSGVAQARSAEMQSTLSACASLNLVEQAGPLAWRYVGDKDDAERLALLLETIAFYMRDIYKDRDRVTVVVTEPARPSKLAEALEASLKGTQGIAATTQTFVEIAQRARKRFCVVTPYVDETAAPVLLQLFAHTQAAVRQLIVRSEGGRVLPLALRSVGDELRRLRVDVFNFRLGRADGQGNETFHAKVVLADDICYVGSFNMNRWSLQYSLELGLVVEGAAAQRIGDILDAITQVSDQIVLR